MKMNEIQNLIHGSVTRQINGNYASKSTNSLTAKLPIEKEGSFYRIRIDP